MPNRRGGRERTLRIDGPGRQDEYRRVTPLADVVQGAGHGEDDRAAHREDAYPLLNVACPGDGLGEGCPTLNLTRRTRQGGTTVRAVGCGADPRPGRAGRGFGQGVVHNGSHEIVGAVVARRDR